MFTPTPAGSRGDHTARFGLATASQASQLLALSLLVFSALACSPAQAEIYRWTDKNGVVHYGDNPPPTANTSSPRLSNNQVDVEQLPYAMREAAKSAPITLYVSAECGQICADARQLLSKRKAPFSEKIIASPEEVAALKKLTHSETVRVPVLVVGFSPTVGFEAGAWQRALDTAGYPK